MAASLGLNPEAFFSSYPFLADYAPSFPAAAAAAGADFSAELDDHRPFEYSPATVFAGAGDDHNEKTMSCESDEKRVNGRIGFRTRSEVEILDDGFKWREVRQEGSQEQRKPKELLPVLNGGCGVKKRVERDRDDPRYVITTYDGVHKHATPGAAATAVLKYAGNYYSPPLSAGSPPAAYSAGSLRF